MRTPRLLEWKLPGQGRSGLLMAFGFLLSLFLAVLFQQLTVRQTLEIEVWMTQDALSPAHIYYAGEAREFHQGKVVRLRKPRTITLGEQPYFAEVRSTHLPDRLRFDLSQRPGEILLHSLKLRTSYGEAYLSANDIRSLSHGLNDGFWKEDNRNLAFLSSGPDPHFTISISTLEIHGEASDELKAFIVSTLVYSIFFFLLFCIPLFFWNNLLRVASRIVGCLDTIGERFSDPPVLHFRRISVLVFLLFLFVFFLYLSLQLHNSSLWQWAEYFPIELLEPRIALGHAQPIRSDEWYGHTPWIFSQAQHGFPVHNASIGPAGSPLLTALPVEGPSMMFQPKFWGLAFLDVERGHSWYWAARLVLLLGSTYLLFLIILRGDEKLSVIATLWLFGSSYTQWWYAFVADIISSFALLAAGSVLIIRSAKVTTGFVGTVLVVFGGLGFLFTLYPPYVLSLSYLLLIVILPSIIWVVRTQREKARWSSKVLLFGLGGGTGIALSIPILVAAWPAIHAISNTDYPGARFALGGDYPLSLLGIGFFEFWRDQASTPSVFPNPSEAAGFALFFPLAVLVAFVKCHDSVARAQLIWATLFGGFLIVWMTAPLPTSIRQMIAYTGWFVVPGARAYLAVGITSILVTVLAVKLVSESGPLGWRGTLLSGSLVALFIGLLWCRYSLTDPAFFSIERLAIAVVVAVLMVLAVSRGSRSALGVAVMLLVLHPIQVNPIHTGLAPLLKNPVFMDMVQQDPSIERKKWLVFGAGRAAQAMKANGMEVFGGIVYAPDRALMSVLDPDDQFRSVWNRYANVTLRPGHAGSPTRFELVHADHYLVEIDPCDPRLSEMGFTHAVFEGNLSTQELGCFEEYDRDEVSGLAYGALHPVGEPGLH